MGAEKGEWATGRGPRGSFIRVYPWLLRYFRVVVVAGAKKKNIFFFVKNDVIDVMT